MILSIGCVTGLIDPLGRQAAPEELPVELEPGLAASLLAFDPAAEWLSCMPCPSCGAEMDVLLDALTLLRTALAGALWRDVYAMASAYHWSEAEILALPVTRRKRYLAIAASMVAGA